MVNYKLTLSYDGTNYHGFQIQKNAVTVQEILEKGLFKIYREKIRIIAASRTDTGVHARGQVINYRAPGFIPPHKVPYALNSVLPDDIRIKEGEMVSPEFHSRHDALGKLYSYTLDRGRFHSVFWRHYAVHIPYPLDVSAMREGARLLKGRHDFTSFCSAGDKVKNREREIIRADWEEGGDWLKFFIEADGFLYNMVRIIVGTLLEVGRNKTDPEKVAEIIKARDRSKAGPTAGARGLCLEKVYYD
ncbi:MAG: tRNA pseudouridine(38-40) synthase TruA [Candidatus Syntrophonatronum acetioxidans]|uniref:tRNA pseudouridine synthase A n=1 Tax=Candidatus Syntrophonatronum acetioxidans TaxID=1795816 RepID=A0A424YH97_9FIRM|nr:MAG: tRNA pseudouridine(38-40) synthase TruA [Candidatus Syntrophonatronum acetioxidans]